MIRISSLHKFFNKGRQNEIHVINDVSLELPQKGMVAIFGKSGCGKTTLLNVIGGLDKFHSGDVEIKGEKIKEKSDDIRNKNIGYIFQNYNLQKEETCFENVANALYLCGITDKTIIEERVMAALKNVDMEKYYKRTPDTLSGGQQQRIAIARAIVKNPPVILADEPTGNLDEANTIMIMNLLKEISKEHLVLLVTHEANLVDFYCDTVIELSDGKVVEIRNNYNAEGYSGRDKNAIYLGEFDKKEVSDEKVELEYYGEAPKEPIKMKIINNGGKLYLKVESEEVSLIDKSSEIKLKEGVFEDRKKEDKKTSLSMSALPPIHGTKLGKLFDFKKSLKTGYLSVSQKRKKGKKMLRRCMTLFAAIIVFMSAMLGISVGDIIKGRDSYNHNVFYVSNNDGTTSKKLNEAVGNNDSGIDYVKLLYSNPKGDSTFSFYIGAFETFELEPYEREYDIKTNAVLMGESLMENLPLVEGKKTELSDFEAVITTKVADGLIEASSFSYIKEYNDLLRLISKEISIDEKTVKIAGIVKSDETAIYLSDRAIARYINSRSKLSVYIADDYNMSVSEGEAVFIANSSFGDKNIPSVGDAVKICGKDIKIKEVYSYKTYEKWISDEGVSKKSEEEYFADLMAEKYPALSNETEEYINAKTALYSEKYADFLEYYYSEYDEYLKYLYIVSPSDFELWLYFEKNVDFAIENVNQHFYALKKLKEENITSPTFEQIKSYNIVIKDKDYKFEYLQSEFSNKRNDSASYLVNEKDYILFSKQIGETDKTAMTHYSKYSDYEYYDGGKFDYVYKDFVETEDGSAYEPQISEDFGTCYTVVHSNNPSLTEKWLMDNFPNLTIGGLNLNIDGNYFSIITPDKIFDDLMVLKWGKIIKNLSFMGIFFILMCLIMYSIMNSSLMSKIKEVGIYRAIGVSKKNLIYRFWIESVVLATVTMLKGYIFASGFIYACLYISPIIESIFFYPLWYALIIVGILYVIFSFFGILPIVLLLRKTPSEILAKYDI